MPHEVHQVGRIFAVVNRECGSEPDPIGGLAQEAGANAMECPCPSQRVGNGLEVVPKTCAEMRWTRRASSAAARREKVRRRMRRGSAPLTIRWATRCARVLVLPEPAPAITRRGPSVIVGHADAVLNSLALLPIELAEIRGGAWHVESAPGLCFQHGSRFVPGQVNGTEP